MADEPLSAELKAKLRKVETDAEKEARKRFDWRRGGGTALLAFITFFLFGFIARAPLSSSLGFALVGALCGFCVGAMRRVMNDER